MVWSVFAYLSFRFFILAKIYFQLLASLPFSYNTKFRLCMETLLNLDIDCLVKHLTVCRNVILK